LQSKPIKAIKRAMVNGFASDIDLRIREPPPRTTQKPPKHHPLDRKWNKLSQYMGINNDIWL